MNGQSDFERFVADQLAAAGVGTPAEAAIEDTIARAGGSRRLPEWLALIKEPPMRTNSHLAVGSPTVRVVVVMTMTLLLALTLATAGAAAQRLVAADRPIVVAQDGSGDYTTITEAVSAAADGQVIQVRPGTYLESVRIEKDITLAGDGDRAEIILDHSVDAPTITAPAPLGDTELQYGLLLEGSDATIRDLTLLARGVAVAIDGGAPLIERLVVDDPARTAAVGEEPDLPESGAFVIEGGANPIIRDVTTNGWVFVGEAAPELTGNQIANEVLLGDGSNSAIHGNEIAHLRVWLASVRTVIEDNDFTGSAWPDEAAKAIYLATNDGSEVTIAGNRIGDPTYNTAVLVSGGGEVTIRDNTIHDSGTGVRSDTGSRAALRLDGNDVEANGWGIVIAEHNGAVMLVDNTVSRNGTGVFLNGSTATEFEGNRVCDNTTNVLLAFGANAPDAAANEICEDDAAG